MAVPLLDEVLDERWLEERLLL